MGGGGQVVGQVAQVVRDLSEGPVLGKIDQPFGHLAEDPVGLGAEALEQRRDAGFAVFGGR